MENKLSLLEEYLENISLHQEAMENELRGVDEDKTPLGTIKYESFKIEDLVRKAINLVDDMKMKL